MITIFIRLIFSTVKSRSNRTLYVWTMLLPRTSKKKHGIMQMRWEYFIIKFACSKMNLIENRCYVCFSLSFCWQYRIYAADTVRCTIRFKKNEENLFFIMHLCDVKIRCNYYFFFCSIYFVLITDSVIVENITGLL